MSADAGRAPGGVLRRVWDIAFHRHRAGFASPLPLSLAAPAFLIGFIALGRWFSRNDEAHITATIRDALRVPAP